MAALPFIYLTSPPFSGSTMFSFLVNTHPAIATVGEMTGLIKSKDPATYICSCGLKIAECPFWKRVSEEMASKHFSFDPAFFDTKFKLGGSQFAERLWSASVPSNALEDFRDRLLTLWPRHRRRLEYLIARNKAFATSVLRVTGKTVFFDASKTPSVIRYLCRDPDIDLRVVHLVRDVRGTSYSRRKNKGETNWRRSIASWIRANRNIESQLKRLPSDKWMRIRYEDVCNAPLDTLNRFFAFCGLASISTTGNFLSNEHHIVGNRMRLANLGEIRLDDSWRNALSLDEQTCSIRLAGSMHIRYGYNSMERADLPRKATT